MSLAGAWVNLDLRAPVLLFISSIMGDLTVEGVKKMTVKQLKSELEARGYGPRTNPLPPDYF